MLCTSDMYTLINYVGFINYLFYGVTVAGQIVLRIRQPNMVRPIKVSAQHGDAGTVPQCSLCYRHFVFSTRLMKTLILLAKSSMLAMLCC